MRTAHDLYLEAVGRHVSVARAVVLDGPRSGLSITLTGEGESAGSLGDVHSDAAALSALQAALDLGTSAQQSLFVPEAGQSLEIFVSVSLPADRLIIVGAVHIAIPLVTFANALGFESIVIDNRTAFATADRFGDAARLLVRWPADALADLKLQASDSIVFLTHDAKIDNPALLLALESNARYVGALGSRKAHARRLSTLREMGAHDANLARIHAPIGLDLGGRAPAEIALAIVAEIVQVKYAA